MESLYYSMNFPKRPKCYIFNQKKFKRSTGLPKRYGTEVDVKNLKTVFTSLQFDVQIFKDKKVSKILKILERISKKDHSRKSCVVCCFLTHGGRGILYGKDGNYATSFVFDFFKEDVCPSLGGKPKIFFIQACQGDHFQGGVDVVYKEYFDCADGKADLTVLTDPDFLIGYSTFPGCLSIRNRKTGSWFIEALCSTLKIYAGSYDLIEVLTIVNGKVAFDFETNNPDEPELHEKKQVPYFVSTLTKDIRFPS